VVEQQLDPAYRLERRPRAGPVDERLRALRGRQLGHLVHRVRRRVPAAQRDPDLAGQHHDAATTGDQQLAREQVLRGRLGVLGQHGVPRRPGRRLAARRQHVVEQRPGLR
jgi:hypothetical protein